MPYSKGGKRSGPRTDSYQVITDRVIEMLENGDAPWRKAWKSRAERPSNVVSGRVYRGINVFTTVMEQWRRGFESPYWLTAKQANDLGGHIRAGENRENGRGGTPIVFYKQLTFEEKDAGGEVVDEKHIPFLRLTSAFNLEQTEDVKVPRRVLEEMLARAETAETWKPIEAAEAIVEAMPLRPEITHGGDRCAYVPSLDKVRMPPRASFTPVEEYYSSLFHELSHATGHPSRVNRPGVMEHGVWGDTNYSYEELIAEFGAAFLCGDAGIEQATLKNSAAYLRSWADKLRSDKHLLVRAAAAAQKAADFILHEAPVVKAEPLVVGEAA